MMIFWSSPPDRSTFTISACSCSMCTCMYLDPPVRAWTVFPGHRLSVLPLCPPHFASITRLTDASPSYVNSHLVSVAFSRPRASATEPPHFCAQCCFFVCVSHSFLLVKCLSVCLFPLIISTSSWSHFRRRNMKAYCMRSIHRERASFAHLG
jgi:hypothetical protein